MFGGRPYSEKVKEVIEHIASSSSEYSHPFYEERKNKSTCYIVVGSDKGLCGGLNINLFKKIVAEAAENQKNGVETSFALIGVKAVTFFGNLGGKVLGRAVCFNAHTPHHPLFGTSDRLVLTFFSKYA